MGIGGAAGGGGGGVIGILAAVSYVLTKYAPKSESRSLLTVMD